jgi:uncharacterized low-complexity protein
MKQKNMKTLALGAAIAGSLAAVSVAQANPFALTTLGSAYMAADDAGAKKAEGEMKCGEGKCGGKKDAAGAEKAEGEGKCGEGKCGAKKEDEKKEGEKKPGQA